MTENKKVDKRKIRWLGEKNPRWNNNASEYKNHALLKKMRIERLRQSLGKCDVCGNKANVIHHIDGFKDNHSLENLVPLCNTCHWAIHKNEYGESSGTSKFIRKYGMTLKQLSIHINASVPTIYAWSKDPEKEHFIYDALKNKEK